MARYGAWRGVSVLALALALPTAGAAQTLRYPQPPRSDVVDDYFGTRVPDPFRPLEAMTSAETVAWIQAENALTDGYLGAIPERERFRRRLQELTAGDYATPPVRGGNLLVYLRRRAGQNQPVLYGQTSPQDTGFVLVDPNALSPDGRVAVPVYGDGGFAPSPDGRLLAYAVARAGSDWRELHVLDVAARQDRPDRVRWVVYSMLRWTRDSRGFFYSRLPQPANGEAGRAALANHQVWYHRVGMPQDSDVLVFARPEEPKSYSGAWVSGDGRYLFIVVNPGGTSENRIYLLDLVDPRRPRVTGKPVALLGDGVSHYVMLNNRGRTFYVLTNQGAPRWRIVAVDLRHPEPAAWKTVVPEGADPIIDADLMDDRLVVHYLHEVHSVLALFRLDGRPAGQVPLPGLGSVSRYNLTGAPGDRDLFYAFTSFLHPFTVFRYDLRTGRNQPFHAPALSFDTAGFETEQVWYASRDGTRIPMFLFHRKGLQLDGTRPALLSVYGGFGTPQLPGFSTSALLWAENGGIWVLPSLRGGGEFGEGWHQAGMKEKKQNTFDDVIAAGEFLVRQRYSAPGRLVLRGASNGGLTVTAVGTQRPDLFAVAIPSAGVMDMLRFPKFTVGAGFGTEYGLPDTPEGFRTLYAYSPLHHLKPGTCYPATLVITGERDDRVVPLHSYKFAAALQADQGCDHPVLLHVAAQTGHGALTPAAQALADAADNLAFAWKNVGLSQPVGAGGGRPQP